MYKYFLSVTLGGEKIEREVTLEEFCQAERAAGFRPKLPFSDPRYMTTPATGGFMGGGINGRTQYTPPRKPEPAPFDVDAACSAALKRVQQWITHQAWSPPATQIMVEPARIRTQAHDMILKVNASTEEIRATYEYMKKELTKAHRKSIFFG